MNSFWTVFYWVTLSSLFKASCLIHLCYWRCLIYSATYLLLRFFSFSFFTSKCFILILLFTHVLNFCIFFIVGQPLVFPYISFSGNHTCTFHKFLGCWYMKNNRQHLYRLFLSCFFTHFFIICFFQSSLKSTHKLIRLSICDVGE